MKTKKLSHKEIEQAVENGMVAPQSVWRGVVSDLCKEVRELHRKLAQAQDIALMDNDEVDALVVSSGLISEDEQ